MGPHLTTKPVSGGSPRGPQRLILSEDEDTACTSILEVSLTLFPGISEPIWTKIVGSRASPDLSGRNPVKG